MLIVNFADANRFTHICSTVIIFIHAIVEYSTTGCYYILCTLYLQQSLGILWAKFTWSHCWL